MYLKLLIYFIRQNVPKGVKNSLNIKKVVTNQRYSENNKKSKKKKTKSSDILPEVDIYEEQERKETIELEENIGKENEFYSQEVSTTFFFS